MNTYVIHVTLKTANCGGKETANVDTMGIMGYFGINVFTVNHHNICGIKI